MTFSAELKDFTKDKAPKWLDRVVRMTVMDAGRRLVMRSPVGNPDLWQGALFDLKTKKNISAVVSEGGSLEGYVGGRFRANWQYGFGIAPAGEIDAEDESGQISLASIQGVLFNPAVGVHYIVNNMPYGQALEDGHSGQAPQGMVGLTEMELPAIVREASK